MARCHKVTQLFIINSFRYEYGKKLPDGSWSGLVGDLTSGNIDLVVADMTMVQIMCFLFCLREPSQITFAFFSI